MQDAFCPKCSGQPIAIGNAGHVRESPRVDLELRCECGVRWTVHDVTLDQVIECGRAWGGASHTALGVLLDVSGRRDDAYEEYAVALRCSDTFDRAFCLERRAAYEQHRGWLRNALASWRQALTEDSRSSGAREARYRVGIATVEHELASQGVKVPPADRALHNKRWLRDCERELPPGYGACNELGQPLADDVIEIERLVRAERWDDAVTALRALSTADANKLVDAIGYASRGADLARAAGRRDAAIALQTLVVHAYVAWASWSTSGGEGLGRTADVERARARLRELERE